MGSSAIGAKVTGYTYVSATETALLTAVQNIGPISVAIYASSNFDAYSSGVLTDSTCNGLGVNHAVVVVGYGTDLATGLDYWLVRNSWSEYWGESGYIKMARNNNNMCMIASYAYYPLV